nr:MAG TPA: hypothetical protein [Caudoviricetes sp.]
MIIIKKNNRVRELIPYSFFVLKSLAQMDQIYLLNDIFDH